MRRRGGTSPAGRVVVVAVALAASVAGCSSDDGTPAAVVTPVPAPSPSVSAPVAPAAAPVLETTVGVGHVAGRLGSRRRASLKQDVADVVDRYLDGAFVAGPWPREDFSAAFVDFRRGAAADASGRDLDLLTHHDVGAALSAVTATKRRLRIDVLAPRGRVGAATARFVLELSTVGSVPGPTRVAGSLFLTRERGTWKVFGYDVRKETA